MSPYATRRYTNKAQEALSDPKPAKACECDNPWLIHDEGEVRCVRCGRPK